MTTVGAYDAKTHLPSLLDRVSRGESITITKRGKPVAMLVPPPTAAHTSPEAALQALREYREKHDLRLNGLKIKDLIAEGRKR
jgi:prevent-host-death family protein